MVTEIHCGDTLVAILPPMRKHIFTSYGCQVSDHQMQGVTRNILMSQTRKTATKKQKSATSFPFLGEALALDLTNTDVLLRGKKHEFLASPQDAEQWWREATLQHPKRDRVKGEEETTQWDATLLENLKHLRQALRSLFEAFIEQGPLDESDLEELNKTLAVGHQSLERGANGEPIAVYQTTLPDYGAILVPIALSALRVITEGERARLHKCANERCVGLFYDTTRSATRHWCSPECMNRARSLQHYYKAKAKNE